MRQPIDLLLLCPMHAYALGRQAVRCRHLSMSCCACARIRAAFRAAQVPMPPAVLCTARLRSCDSATFDTNHASLLRTVSTTSPSVSGGMHRSAGLRRR